MELMVGVVVGVVVEVVVEDEGADCLVLMTQKRNVYVL